MADALPPAADAEQRLAWLLRAGDLLAAALDYEATLDALARLAVPYLADWCAVDLLAADGTVELLTVAPREAEHAAWAREWWEQHRPHRDDADGVGAVIRTGRPLLLPNVDEAGLRDRADAAQSMAARRVGLISLICVPLRAGATILGALTLVSAESGRHYTPADLALAVDLGRRAGMAVENARLRRAVATERFSHALTLESIGDAVISTDAGGRVQFMNSVAEALTGWPATDALGRPLPEVFHIIDEQTGRPAPDLTERVLREGVVTGLPDHTVLIARDGQRRPIDDSGAPIRDAEGAIAGAVLVFHDITARRAAEAAQAELASIVESSGDAVLSKTLDGTIRSWNAAAARLYGYTADEMIGRSVALIIPPEGQDELVQILARIAEGSRVERSDAIRVRKDGTRITVALTVSPIRDHAGRIIGASAVAHELKERGEALAARRESEARFRSIIDSAMDAIITVDAHQRIVLCNAAAERMFGCPATEAVGQPLERFIPARFRELHRRHIREFGRTGVTNRAMGALGALSGVRCNGEEFPIEASISQVEAGGEKLYTVILRDITERMQAEAALRESEARFRLLADSAPVLIWMAGADGRCVYVNRRWREFTGRRMDQELGEGWATAVHPDDRTRCLALREAALAAREPFQMEYRLRRADGVYRWVLDSGLARWTEAGEFAGSIGSALDISERKEAEETQRFLSEAGRVLAASLDYQATLSAVARLAIPVLADACLIDVVEDDGTVRRAAFAAAEPTIEAALRDMQERYPADARAAGTRRVLETGPPLLVPDLTDEFLQTAAVDAEHLALQRRAQGRSLLVMPMRARGRVLGTLQLGMNTSGRRFGPDDVARAAPLAERAALAIDNARLFRDAEAALRLREQFFALAAHELRTPITTVHGYAQLLQRRLAGHADLDPREARALASLTAQTRRLDRLISALLDLSRIQAGHFTLERGPVDLTELVQHGVEDLRMTLERHHVDLERPPDLVLVDGDALRLEQVLQNLLSNAVKYSPAGGLITVRVWSEGDRACFSVRDPGIGIPADALPQLFQRFYRAPNVAGHQISGVGIGLYVIQEIVALHGGEVTVESVEDRGSTFTVCLPR